MCDLIGHVDIVGSIPRCRRPPIPLEQETISYLGRPLICAELLYFKAEPRKTTELESVLSPKDAFPISEADGCSSWRLPLYR